ncbi:MAG: hypothetical protein NZ957_00705 [Thaumarchaeota archaeon]|nr:hypothetical protein [Candidatus Calditenuaceae archaeon]
MVGVARAIAPVVSTIVMNSIGSYVSARGAGLACPDWPLCPLEMDELVILEFSHRAFALVVLVSVIAVLIPAMRMGGLARKLAVTGVILLIVQIAIGGVMVLSALRPELVAVHMASASSVLAVFAMLAAHLIFGGKR